MMGSAVGAAAFLGGVLMLPPTQPKETWTSVHKVTPPLADEPTAVVTEEQPVYQASYVPPAPEPPFEPRPERQEEVVRDDASSREIVMADDDRAYGDGYSWASENEVQDRRECRRLSGPRADGCRDFVASLASEREEAEREF